MAGRVVPFSVFDVALMMGLPATGEIEQFGDKGEATELGRIVREWMAEYVEAK